ncbi:nuclear RNA export factor 2-like isoform X2 [Phymastichus coffea]|nr:nuclear RNA export factor 2-like isoform X2 [Phymastichus coffea]XP_058800787.1 nuclear RNA export factor 2-like isoform X2 [Phymastichus coffea]
MRPNLVDIGSVGKSKSIVVPPVPPHQIFSIPADSQASIGLIPQMSMQGMMHHGMGGGMIPQLGSMQASGTVPGANPSAPIKPIVIDSSSAIQIANCSNSTYQERNLMARNDIWHNILVVRGARYEKENVLKCILKSVYPADLVPVRYQEVGNDSCFLARNCDRALDALCKTSLIVQYIDGSPLILSITLGYASIHDLKINIQPLLLHVLKKRYKIETKVLDLEEFHKDPDIYDMVYCPLSQNKTFVHVLKLARTVSGAFESLSLKNNELISLPLSSLDAMKFVKHLDLRFNNLLRIQDLEQLKPYNITELWLDGNPLCENYSSPRQYVEAVRAYCPKLIKLDGIQINSPGLPLIYKSYVKNWKRRKLVEQFVEHFFTAYDHKDRSVMRGLYDKNAWYSMTVGTPTSPTSKKLLEPFSSENRNLLIFGKNSQELIRYGEDQILKVFKKLPASQHIFKSFYIDLMVDSDEFIIISVDGLFKLVNVPNQLFLFNRLFVLTPEDDNEYKVVNDQYHICVPVQPIDYKAYITEDDKKTEFEATVLSPNKRKHLIIRFQEWTTMKLEYCERYLKEAEWDAKKALSNFMIDYKNKYVAEEAFP